MCTRLAAAGVPFTPVGPGTPLPLDLRRDDLARLPECDAVINLFSAVPRGGAPSLREILETNVLALERFFEWCAAHKCFVVHASSASIYGRSSAVSLAEDASPNPEGTYAASKLLGEKIAGELLGPHAVLRPSSVYGLGQPPGSVLPLFVERAKAKRPLLVHGRGERATDFVHVDDVASAFVSAALSRRAGTFNIGSGHATPMRELAETVNRAFQGAGVEYDASAPDDGTRLELDISRARRELSFNPRSLEQGLTELSEGFA